VEAFDIDFAKPARVRKSIARPEQKLRTENAISSSRQLRQERREA
jgi:hypothetical protein